MSTTRQRPSKASRLGTRCSVRACVSGVVALALAVKVRREYASFHTRGCRSTLLCSALEANACFCASGSGRAKRAAGARGPISLMLEEAADVHPCETATPHPARIAIAMLRGASEVSI
eukprot:2761590-Pyramimonas_sp.AAC.2